MRVELRVEEDQRDMAVTVEVDRATEVDDVIGVARDAMQRLRALPKVF